MTEDEAKTEILIWLRDVVGGDTVRNSEEHETFDYTGAARSVEDRTLMCSLLDELYDMLDALVDRLSERAK